MSLLHRGKWQIARRNGRGNCFQHPPALAVLSARRSTQRIFLAMMNIERKEETDARRLLRGIVNRRRHINTLRVVIGVPIHRPVLTPAALITSIVVSG